MFVSRILDWYLEEVQTALQKGDWSKADEVLGMIATYQQARNQMIDIRPERIRAEVRYNKMHVFL